MNILITDYHCASNRGDAAILEGVYQSLQSEYPSSNITVMTEYPRAAELIHGINATEQVLADFQWMISEKNAARGYLSLTSWLYNRDIRPPGFDYIRQRGKIQPYLDADLVISTGGQFLTDIYFPGKVGVLWEHYFLKQIETPVVIYAQTLGPFKKPLYRKMNKTVLERIDLIITRDNESKTKIENMGISTPIHFTADAAFSMEMNPTRDIPLDTLDTSDPLPDEDTLTVSISVREWQHTNTPMNEYLSAVADVADWLIEEKGADVLFASTCTGLDGYHKDDRLVAAQVVSLMQHGKCDEVQILTGEYTPQQLVHIYEQMDLHIGMRMHSNILAMMAETPIVAIQYQFKTKGVMEMFDISTHMIDIDDVTSGSLLQLVKTAFEDRFSIADTISSKLPTIKKESHRSASIVKKHFEDEMMEIK